MATKKVLNVGKIMVLSGAVIILIMVAFLCGFFLKETHKKKTSSDIPIPQTTMTANQVVPATTAEITTTTTQTAVSETTTTITTTAVSGTVTTNDALTVRGDGEFQEYVIKLANPSLNIYSEPSYNSMVAGVITDRGSYVITKEFIDDDGNKWGLLETEYGWINLIDARKSDPNDDTYQPVVPDDENADGENNNNNDNNNNNNNNNSNNNAGNGGNGGLTGVDADGDGWDDGWNPDAWCPYCGYDSYYNADGSLTCSQGHTWSY